MRCANLIAALYFLLPPVINAEKGNKDDNWIDPFYMESKNVASDWMDPFDLEDNRDLQKTIIKSSPENEIEELPKESENDKLVENMENSGKNMQINEDMEVSAKMLGKNVGGSTETDSNAKIVKNLENQEEEICHCEKNEMERNFVQRFINLLVNTCVSKNNEIQEAVSLTLKISPEEIKELERLKDYKDVAPAIRLLNTIISDMRFNDHREDKSSFFHWIIQLISSKEVWMEIGVISFAILPSCLFILGGRLTRIICITVLMTFSVSYYGTYRYLRLKAKEKNERILSNTLACTPDERSWYHSIFGSTSDSECQKKWDALHIDPSAEVTPVNVISHMMGVIIFQPLDQFGVMFSSFSSHIFESQPLLRGMIVYTTAVMIIVLVIYFCCYGIHNRSRGLGSHDYPYTYTGHRLFHTEPSATSFRSTNRNQIFNPRGRNQVPDLYDALPQQPVYIITNYSDHVPKNAITKNVRVKSHLPGKGEISTYKRKSGKFIKRNAKNSCVINGDTEINNVPSDKTDTSDDET